MSGLAMSRYYGAVGAEPAGRVFTWSFLKADGSIASVGQEDSLTSLDKALADAVKTKGAVSGDALAKSADGTTILIRRLQGGTMLVNEAFPVGGGLLGKAKANKGYVAAGVAGLLAIAFFALK